LGLIGEKISFKLLRVWLPLNTFSIKFIALMFNGYKSVA